MASVTVQGQLVAPVGKQVGDRLAAFTDRILVVGAATIDGAGESAIVLTASAIHLVTAGGVQVISVADLDQWDSKTITSSGRTYAVRWYDQGRLAAFAVRMREAGKPATAPARPAVPDSTGAYRFNPPPGWPPLPDEWEPPDGWKAPADWPAPPDDWAWWVIDEPAAAAYDIPAKPGTAPAAATAPVSSAPHPASPPPPSTPARHSAVVDEDDHGDSQMGKFIGGVVAVVAVVAVVYFVVNGGFFKGTSSTGAQPTRSVAVETACLDAVGVQANVMAAVLLDRDSLNALRDQVELLAQERTSRTSVNNALHGFATASTQLIDAIFAVADDPNANTGLLGSDLAAAAPIAGPMEAVQAASEKLTAACKSA